MLLPIALNSATRKHAANPSPNQTPGQTPTRNDPTGPKLQRAGVGAIGGGGGGGASSSHASDPSDVYSKYRNMRSGAYHEMIYSGGGASNTARGGR